MPKPWRLTPAAKSSLLDIARWTLKTFGPRQAEAYEEDLIAACWEIAAGTALSRDCRPLMGPSVHEDLRFTRCGQHFVVFVEDPARVNIVAFLHKRSNLPRKLASLADPRSGRNR